MSLSLLGSSFRSAADGLDQATKAAESLSRTMERIKGDRKANELDALREQPVFQLWLEIAAWDANHPDLNKLEWYIRQYVMRVGTNVFAELRGTFRRLQQQRRRRGGQRALGADDVEALLSEYRGA